MKQNKINFFNKKLLMINLIVLIIFILKNFYFFDSVFRGFFEFLFYSFIIGIFLIDLLIKLRIEMNN